jgi:hypothetical protein
MRFKDALHGGADRDLLHWIAEKVADHSDMSSLWQFDKYSQIGSMLLQGSVRRVPYAFPAEDLAARFYFGPRRIECMALMANPFRAELPSPAMAAPLHQQAILAQSIPVRS